jgi:hypothetical protein
MMEDKLARVSSIGRDHTRRGVMPVLTIDRTVFFFLFFFLADLSYVGFVLVSDFWDISDRKQISLFVSKNKSSPMDLFLS